MQNSVLSLELETITIDRTQVNRIVYVDFSLVDTNRQDDRHIISFRIEVDTQQQTDNSLDIPNYINTAKKIIGIKLAHLGKKSDPKYSGCPRGVSQIS